MTYASLSPPTPRFIDTSPITARYALLMAAMMAYISARRTAKVLRLSFKLRHLVRVFIRADRHNRLLQRKRAMLSHPGWRMRVLRELGGVRRLALWEAARRRIRERALRPTTSTPSSPRVWRVTPERLALSEKLKARARRHAKACRHPNILRDRVKMDFDGLFRLAPLPRGPKTKPQIRIFTAADISDYRYNAMPFAPGTELGPAIVWPVEFYAAILAEMEREQSERYETTPIPLTLPLLPAKAGIQISRPDIWIPNQVWDEREEKEEFMSLPAFMGKRSIDTFSKFRFEGTGHYLMSKPPKYLWRSIMRLAQNLETQNFDVTVIS